MRRQPAFILLFLFLICATLLFIALGVWQLERRAWKLDLIAQVDRQMTAPAVAAPAAASGDDIVPYQRVYTDGQWLQGKEIYALAVTRLGRGYWQMVPLQTDRGFTVWINRGFVREKNPRTEDLTPLPAGPVRISGLLRASEPPYGFLQHNKPDEDRWYSRDVAQMTAQRGLGAAAPYFIDADKAGDGYPAGGLTVVTFRNQHMSYALTWFGMAAVCLFFLFRLRKVPPRA